MNFTRWQTEQGYGVAPYNKNSPNLMAVFKWLDFFFPAIYSLGCYGVRKIKSGDPNETTISTHAFGAAIDISCSTTLSLQVIDAILKNHVKLHVQMIIDYKRRRIWKFNRGWKDHPNLHGGGGSWIHIETTKEGWNDSQPVHDRLNGTAPVNSTPAVRVLLLTTPNMRGEDVKKLQEALNKHLPIKLDVDGIFGGKTDGAVRSFQTLKKIFVDGKVGPQTWSKL